MKSAAVKPEFSHSERITTADLADTDEWRLHRDLSLRGFILIGLLLSYIWRFHDLHPVLRPLRLAAIFSVSSWLLLVFQPNWGQLSRALRLPFVWLFLVWSIWMFLGAFTGLWFERSWAFLTGDHLKSIALFLFAVGGTRRFRDIVLSTNAHLLGAFVLSLFYAKGGFPTWGAPVPMYDVNDLALLLCISLPFAFRLATTATVPWQRLAGWAVAVLLAFSIVATRSRGAFITLIVVAAYMLLRFEGVSIWKRLAPVVLIVAGFAFASENARTRIATIFSLEEDYNLTAEEGRIAIWKRGLGYMMSNPLLGVGAGNFTTAERRLSESRGMVAHNSYVEVGAETGLVGGLLFLGMLASGMRAVLRTRRFYASRREWQHRVAMCDALTAALLAWLVGAFFLAWGYSVILYAILACIAGLAVAQRQLAAQLRGRARG